MAQDLEIHCTNTHRGSEIKRQQHLLKSHTKPGGLVCCFFQGYPVSIVVSIFLVSTFPSTSSRKHQLLLNSQDVK